MNACREMPRRINSRATERTGRVSSAQEHFFLHLLFEEAGQLGTQGICYLTRKYGGYLLTDVIIQLVNNQLTKVT